MNRFFRFKNIEITNGGKYVLVGTSNLETGSATKRKVNYIDTDGTEYRDILYSERLFEISGIIMAEGENEMVHAKRKLIEACSLKDKFRIQYCNRLNVYSAECYFDKLPTFGARKKWCLPFKLYLTIPGFYWQSKVAYSFNLLSYQDEVIEEFTLPCVFTSYSNEAEVYNNGDVESYPVFTITCQEEGKADKLVIKDATSGKTITINYVPQKGEVITVNSREETIQSNLNGNITASATLDSVFFPVLTGHNYVVCEGDGNKIVMEFYENYLGV